MNKKIRVIFLVDVEDIAEKGEVKEIGEAFARNFLLPKQKALAYNRTIDIQLQQQKTKLEEQQALRRNKEEEIFANIQQKELIFFLKEKSGQTFGSITALDITKALQKEFNIQISGKKLLNFKPLHEKGSFFTKVKVGKNLIAKLQITIKSSQENIR